MMWLVVTNIHERPNYSVCYLLVDEARTQVFALVAQMNYIHIESCFEPCPWVGQVYYGEAKDHLQHVRAGVADILLAGDPREEEWGNWVLRELKVAVELSS